MNDINYRQTSNELRAAWLAYRESPVGKLSTPSLVSFVAGWNAAKQPDSVATALNDSIAAGRVYLAGDAVVNRPIEAFVDMGDIVLICRKKN